MSELISNLLRFWENPLLLTAVIFLVLALAYGWGGFGGRSRAIQVAKHEHGTVSISTEAIEEIVEQICHEIPTLQFRRCLVHQGKTQVSIVVHLLVAPGIRLRSAIDFLDQQIDHNLRVHLDFENLSAIDIVVDGFLPHPRSPRQLTESVSQEEQTNIVEEARS